MRSPFHKSKKTEKSDKPAGTNKFFAKRTEVDGHIFDSKREAAVYQQLVERVNLGH